MKPNDLTPVQQVDGLWVKREDLFTGPAGTNGSKLRMAYHLLTRAKDAGVTHVFSAQSVLSPQAVMTAHLCRDLNMDCTLVVGGTTPEKAIRHPYIRSAVDQAGANLECAAVGYNPVIQKFAAHRVEEENLLGDGLAWQMPYGITTPPDATEKDIEAFLRVGGAQVGNLPRSLRTIIIPFGSGNTACGILYGLHNHLSEFTQLERVVLVGVGPDRFSWLVDRLKRVTGGAILPGVDLVHMTTYPKFAVYSDRMPESLGDIDLHPTYEGKVVRYLNHVMPDWWALDTEDTLLWIVGGPVK